jgi:hypothetical protein
LPEATLRLNCASLAFNSAISVSSFAAAVEAGLNVRIAERARIF